MAASWGRVVSGDGAAAGASKVVADLSMSLDGYVTGPDPDLHHGLGHGTDRLHIWAALR